MVWNIIGLWLSFNALVVAVLYVGTERSLERERTQALLDQ